MQENEPISRHTWYIRRDQQIEGPFTSGLISQYVLLERVNNDTELSHDLTNWQPLSELPELIPSVMKADLSDPQAYERFLAARRWADERSRNAYARQLREEEADWDGEDRRQQEAWENVQHQVHEAQTEETLREEGRNRLWGTLLALAILVLISMLVFFNSPPKLEEENACAQPPRPGINWSSCLMEGADIQAQNLTGADLRNMNLSGANLAGTIMAHANLSYTRMSVANLQGADLSSAILVGAGLRGANLANADLSGADLSYVEFTDANLSGANLANARLDNAIWIDGQYCAPGSVGQCNIVPRPQRKRL